MRSFVLALVLFACSTPKAPEPVAPAPAPKPDVIIGEVVALTGPEATFGFSARDGIELAVREANAKGGISGRKIVVKVQDSRGRPEEAAAALTRVLDRDKPVAVLGDIASTNTLAIAPIAQKRQVPLLTPASTAAAVTKVGDYVFRACFSDAFQGRVMAIFAADELKQRKAAILRDGSSDYSIGLANEFKRGLTEFGGEIVADETFMRGDVHFKAQLTKIREKKPEVLFVPGTYAEVGLILRQAKELGLNATMLGGDGWDSPRLVEVAGVASEGAHFSTHFASDADAPLVKHFVQEFTSTFGYDPDGFAAMGYESGRLLIDALSRATALEPAAVQKALSETKKVAGLSGDIVMGADHEPQKPAFIMKVSQGKFKYETRIWPK